MEKFRAISRFFIIGTLLGSCFAVTPLKYSEPDTEIIVGQISSLKRSVDASAKEQWEALQSLRFHLLSARTGLKEAVEEIQKLKTAVASCKIESPPSVPTPEIDSNEPTTTTTAAPLSCNWPGDRVGSHCIIVVTEHVKNWYDAEEDCRSKGATLVGEDVFESLTEHLTTLFGVDSETRVRWSFWVGAQQRFEGWFWSAKEWHSFNATSVEPSQWAENQPQAVPMQDLVTPHCMALDGFMGYRGVSVSCNGLRRFVCQIY